MIPSEDLHFARLRAEHAEKETRHKEACEKAVADLSFHALRDLALSLSCTGERSTLGYAVAREIQKRIGFVSP